MSKQSVSISQALCLPAPSVNALAIGQMTAILARGFLRGLNSQFALCPVDGNGSQTAATITHWAKVEGCKPHKDPEKIDALSLITTWSREQLNAILQERPHFFLAYVRVYRLSESIPVENGLPTDPLDDFGTFIRLSQSISAPLTHPVLDEQTFQQRHQQLINLTPPQYPQLQQLQQQVAQLDSPEAKALNRDMQQLLGWNPPPANPLDHPNYTWIQDIKKVGYSSDGDAFEKIVRKSLIFLGFSNSLNDPKASLDPNTSGGAAGIDVYADKPFLLVGECKASASGNIPNKVAQQLVFLGQTNLGKKVFDASIKILFVAGNLTDPAEKGAIENQMNVIRPETLQRFVELRFKYPGSISLEELESCLAASPFGEDSDEKINKFIDKNREVLKIRSSIIQIVKQSSNDPSISLSKIEAIYNFNYKDLPSLSEQQIREILIELSSPLTGYLGRKKGDDGCDRFYFLRDLIVE